MSEIMTKPLKHGSGEAVPGNSRLNLSVPGEPETTDGKGGAMYLGKPLPTLGQLHTDCLVLRGLVEAMDRLVDQIAPGGGALFACIVTALPLVRKLADDMEGYANV